MKSFENKEANSKKNWLTVEAAGEGLSLLLPAGGDAHLLHLVVQRPGRDVELLAHLQRRLP